MTSVSNAVLATINGLTLLTIFVFLINACSQPNQRSDKEMDYNQANLLQEPMESAYELTTDQQSAFDALNTLQVSTDEMNRLYSTFAGITQPCYPPDTSLQITQSELLIAMKQFVISNCKGLSVEAQEELASSSVLAQNEYTVLLCLDDTTGVNYEIGVPRIGTWVLPGVLGRRDVIIAW